MKEEVLCASRVTTIGMIGTIKVIADLMTETHTMMKGEALHDLKQIGTGMAEIIMKIVM
jgi:hypothetical protein